MTRIKKIILVLSGKGGVGKSSVSTQIALSAYLSNETIKIGLLDIDLCGPSIPRMLHIDDNKVMQTASGWIPVYLDVEQRFAAMSIGLLLPNKDSAVVWRGPKKNAMIKQFVESVAWGDLDLLVVDTPPGTSDEHLAILEAFANHENISAVIVTTPQLVAIADVEKEIAFCKAVNIKVDGIIENMSGYQCKSCAHTTNIFSSGGGQQLSEKHGLRFLGKVPISPEFSRMIERQSLNLLTEYSRNDLSLTFRDIFKKLSE